MLLCDPEHLLPPSEHVEKGESERSEKSSSEIPKELSKQIWQEVKNLIMPILHPALALAKRGSSSQDTPGRRGGGGGERGGDDDKSDKNVLKFRHSAIQSAVGRVYFNGEKDDVFGGTLAPS